MQPREGKGEKKVIYWWYNPAKNHCFPEGDQDDSCPELFLGLLYNDVVQVPVLYDWDESLSLALSHH